MLTHPDFKKPFYLATDASGSGVSAVLFQKEDESKEESGGEKSRDNHRYISFAARSLQPAERNYSATKKEALAIIYGLTMFRYYLLGRDFEAYTDHKALTYLFW